MTVHHLTIAKAVEQFNNKLYMKILCTKCWSRAKVVERICFWQQIKVSAPIEDGGYGKNTITVESASIENHTIRFS
jgi:hypothetical protein